MVGLVDKLFEEKQKKKNSEDQARGIANRKMASNSLFRFIFKSCSLLANLFVFV